MVQLEHADDEDIPRNPFQDRHLDPPGRVGIMSAREAVHYYVDVTFDPPGSGSREVVKTLGPFWSETAADTAERGLNRNLDHVRYYTVARQVGS